MKKQRFTIEDIAQLTNVSKTTVSRYLNGKYEYMSAETKLKIEQVVKEHNYRPNQIARTLKTKRSNVVAIVCPGITVQSSPRFLEGVDRVLRKAGYEYEIFSSANAYDRECTCFERCIDQQVDGILFSPATEKFDYAISISESQIPVVVYDRHTTDWPYQAACINYSESISMIMDHLRANGYEDITMLTGTYSKVDTRYQREQAFRAYMEQWRGSFSERHILRYSPKAQHAEEVLAAYIRRPAEGPRALLTVNMLTLQAVLKAKKNMGFQIPGDFALCGYDSWNWADLVTPSITCFKEPLYEMGCEAAKLLLNQINGKSQKQRKVVYISGQLNMADSTIPYWK